jgi:hypothetical protein
MSRGLIIVLPFRSGAADGKRPGSMLGRLTAVNYTGAT